MNSKMELIFQKNNIGLGKRKQAIARVFLIPGEGNLIINKKPGDKYLQYNDTYLNTSLVTIRKIKFRKTI
jgi:ribosomal protein S9